MSLPLMMSAPPPVTTFSTLTIWFQPSPEYCHSRARLIETISPSSESRTTVSIPSPPSIRSTPVPAIRISSPPPPDSWSLPSPPSRMSPASPPYSTSVPAPPDNSSAEVAPRPSIRSSMASPTNSPPDARSTASSVYCSTTLLICTVTTCSSVKEPSEAVTVKS